MIEKVLSNMGGVDAYGVISICIFFACFGGILLWAFSLKKTYLNSMRDLPLDGGSAPESESPSTSTPEAHHERE
jgi:hypothetical protein